MSATRGRSGNFVISGGILFQGNFTPMNSHTNNIYEENRLKVRFVDSFTSPVLISENLSSFSKTAIIYYGTYIRIA